MSFAERSAVAWGTTAIPYEIRRSSRRATVSLTIEHPASGGAALLVTAPADTPISQLDSVVRAKARWVVARLGRERDVAAPPSPRELVSGETFLYLGRQCRLRLLPQEEPAPMRLRGGWLELPVPRGLERVHEARYARAALIDWYRRLAAERLPGWTQEWAKRIGASVERVIVSDQAKRWGSCSAGVIRFNWRVMQVPRALVEYVVAHEVVHVVHEHHGREFWAALGRVMPDYEGRRARLRTVGERVVW